MCAGEDDSPSLLSFWIEIILSNAETNNSDHGAGIPIWGCWVSCPKAIDPGCTHSSEESARNFKSSPEEHYSVEDKPAKIDGNEGTDSDLNCPGGVGEHPYALWVRAHQIQWLCSPTQWKCPQIHQGRHSQLRHRAGRERSSGELASLQYRFFPPELTQILSGHIEHSTGQQIHQQR